MKKLLIPIVAVTTIFLAGSCKKEATTAPEPKNTNWQTISGFNSLEMYGGKFRKVTADYKNCTNIEENCHPQDIVITGAQQSTLDAAIMSETIGTLFSNDATATQFIPEWNNTWFEDVRLAILSGQYTFLKAGPSLYLLGVKGTLNNGYFVYALHYQIQ